ncbi:putative ribonuclease H protein [Vitis vinifera]|uniref:Putative ribonuclease H protein n=1 Tax=Vitis vinifera TaxID=29760 RepID=A0A438JRW2_VITVI|nr:putative ribonuclease H protein [Vitis vinifera]
MANAHRRRHTMDRIKVSGVWLSKKQEVRTGIVDAFQWLLTEDSEWKADIGRLNLNQISQQEADTLELPFMEEEVHSALMDMNDDKAPGPDGFTVAFWQFCWEFVKEEVLEMFKEFLEQNVFLKSLNNTFLVLANRIKNVIGRVVSSDHNAFVMGRQILDASLIANEFLMRVMQKMGFGAKWRDWIWSCISIAKFSVLVNGEPTRFFSSSKGLRQGDPISPYLLVMGMEVLSALIRRAVEGGCISGKDDMIYLSWILCWFEAVSGLRINLAKSEIIPVGEVEEILEMTVELGCKVGQLPSTYLGLPLGASNKAACVWDGVEERMRWKLALWKRQYISKGGRITLIKSTLASMPFYQLSLFRMLRTVARRLEKLQRDFLWGGGSAERKAHLVNWERVCVDLLGPRRRCGNVFLWQNMGKRNLGGTKKANGVFGVGVWKEILKEADWRFPQLFNVAAQRNATMRDMWDQNSGQGGWNLWFIRGFNDWELNMGIWVENVPSKLAFLRGKLLGGGFLPLIGFKREDGSFLIVVIYVMCIRELRERVENGGDLTKFHEPPVEHEIAQIMSKCSSLVMAKFWVAIESKTFEVSIEEIKGKLKGIIVERSRGFSSWIRFGASGLRKLLECFEECCREEKKGRLVKVWEEEGRKFRLERRVNGAGRYVLCSVVDVEAKRFCLVFPEGKGVIGGWAILAVKLRALGIVTKKDDKGVEATQISSKKKDATIDDEEERCSGKKKQGEIRSFLDVAKGPAGRVGEELWLQVGGRGLRRREEVLGRCLVGRWEGAVMEMELDSLKNWGKRSWNLRKGVKVMKMGEPFFLLEFEDEGEAERVLNRGTRRFKDRLLHLERWNEEAGCLRMEIKQKKYG